MTAATHSGTGFVNVSTGLGVFFSPAVSLFAPKIKAGLEASLCLCGSVLVRARYFSCHSSYRDLMVRPSNMSPLFLLQKEMKLVWWTVWWKLYSLEQPSVTVGSGTHATVTFYKASILNMRHVITAPRSHNVVSHWLSSGSPRHPVCLTEP